MVLDGVFRLFSEKGTHLFTALLVLGALVVPATGVVFAAAPSEFWNHTISHNIILGTVHALGVLVLMTIASGVALEYQRRQGHPIDPELDLMMQALLFGAFATLTAFYLAGAFVWLDMPIGDDLPLIGARIAGTGLVGEFWTLAIIFAFIIIPIWGWMKAPSADRTSVPEHDKETALRLLVLEEETGKLKRKLLEQSRRERVVSQRR